MTKREEAINKMAESVMYELEKEYKKNEQITYGFVYSLIMHAPNSTYIVDEYFETLVQEVYNCCENVESLDELMKRKNNIKNSIGTYMSKYVDPSDPR